MKNFLRSLLSLAALATATVGLAQVPTWPKTTPADITAAGISVQLTGADYGNGTFVLAVYFGGSTAVPAITPAVYTSPDGTAWTRRTLPVTGARVGPPRFLNGKFYLGMDLATNANGVPTGANGAILSSTDGITWSATTLSSPFYGPGDFAFGNGVYVGVVTPGSGQANQLVTSSDGATWTPRAILSGLRSNHVTFFNGKFYATCSSATAATSAAAGLYSSADGIAWTKIAGAPANPGILAATGSTLLTTFFSGSTSGQSLSSDGATFTTTSPGIVLQTETVKVLNGAFVVTASPSPTNFDLTLARASFDGRTWATIGSTTNQFYANEVAYGNGRYVFVGEFDVFSGTSTISPGGTSGGGGGTPAPTITTPLPATPSASLGGSFTFTIVASGTGLTYQWFFNGVAIGGAINASYTLSGLTAANTGSYTVAVTNAGGTANSSASMLTVNSAPASFAFLNNLSVRARAGSGSETLIVGVTVGGSAVSTAKTALIRGVGPTLASFGVTGLLADPVLTVLSGTTVIATNDDWNNDTTIATTSAAVGAFPLLAGSRDAALFGNGLGNGGYSVQVTGKAGATGNALVELYDTAAPASITATTTRFINVSARTFGGTGAETLIVGFNVAGTGSRRLVIRAVGPGLAAFGVTGTMPDPKLELYSGTTKINENDNWDATTLAAQQSVGAFNLTSGSRDAVLVTVLNPGPYTVQVTGGTTGVVLVEAYEAP